MSFQVLRRVGSDNYPNGTFETLRAAEAVARHVKEFHGPQSVIVIHGPEGSVEFDAPVAVDAETGESGVRDASEEQRTEAVGVRRQGRKVGKKASLRHRRKTAHASRQETQTEVSETEPEETFQEAMSG